MCRLRTCVVKEVGSFKKNSGSNKNVLNNSPLGDKALVSLQTLNLIVHFSIIEWMKLYKYFVDEMALYILVKRLVCNGSLWVQILARRLSLLTADFNDYPDPLNANAGMLS
jgi:hypothetical protein